MRLPEVRIHAVCVAIGLWALALPAAAVVFPLQPGEVVATCYSGSNPGADVVGVVDLRSPATNAPGLDKNWLAPMFHHPSWKKSNLGEVFGIALDDASPPNIYLTSTSSYNSSSVPYFPGSGKVFKLDGTTGAISTFAVLPNSGQGLGNIVYDRAHKQFFVTDFFDGKIYRLSGSGAVLDTFDPFLPYNAAASTSAGFAPLGERLWGVGVFGNRVYFGVWSRDARAGAANTIWSVALTTVGGFSGAETKELTLPASRLMPVSDIAFALDGRMLLAKRGMNGDQSTIPHQARVLEYQGGHLAWVPTANSFSIGVNPGSNSAGGVDYICPADESGFVVATGDALHLATGDLIYGLQLLPGTGGSPATSYLIDLDANLTQFDKTQIGDVEAYNACNRDCLELVAVEVLCTTKPGSFLIRFKVKNNSSAAAHHLFVIEPSGITANPNHISFSGEPGGSLAAGSVSSNTYQVQIQGATAASTLTLQLSLHDEDLSECCATEQEIDLPSCDCGQITSQSLTCSYFGPNPTFSFNFVLQNLSPPPPLSYVLVTSTTPGITVSQSTAALSPPLAFGGTVPRQISFSGPGAQPGGTACFRISVHESSFQECCSFERCVTLPKACSFKPDSPINFTNLDSALVLFSEAGLEVEGIGNTGNDGIRFNLGPVDSTRVHWRDLGATQDGAFLKFESTGRVGGVSGRPLGELKVADAGAAFEVTVDYSAVGSTSQRLVVYRDGEQVAVIPGHQGLTARVSALPTSCGKGLVEIDGLQTACYWPWWNQDISIEIPGGPTVVGDSLQVLAEKPSGELEALETFSVLAALIPKITITGVEAETVAADLDLNLNTGFDQTTLTTLPRGSLPEGTPDDDWRIVSPAPNPALLVIGPNAVWRPALPDSEWISANPNQGISIPGASKILFEYCFCLGSEAVNAELDLQLRADVEASVFLNGVLIGGPGGGYGSASPMAVHFSGPVDTDTPFKAGQNCLQVEVNDFGGVVTGLNLTGTVQAERGACAVADSPALDR